MKKLGIVESAMRHRQIVFLISSMLVVLGIYALFVMPRQEFPTFTIRQGLVIAAYPGASSQEVEEQLTAKVEKYLFGFKEVKKRDTYSYSKDGLMVIYVKLNDNVKNSDEFWSKLNHGLNNLKTQLPPGVSPIQIDSDFGDTSALLVAIEANNKSYHEIEDYMDELENRLRRLQSVSKIRHQGLQQEQINVYLEKEKLTNYGISSTGLLTRLFSQGFTSPNGSIDNTKLVAPIHVKTTYDSVEDLGQQIIYTDPDGNHIVRLKDVARIVREYPTDPDSYVTNNGNKCLLISMEMQRGNNIVQYGKDVDVVLNQYQSELPEGVKIVKVADQPKVVGDSIDNFMHEMGFAIIAVILVTMVLLPLRVASVAATSIPISIFISMGIMLMGGLELNTVTLAALIVVLGMIVDNSIVIVDSYMEKLDHGMSRWNASITSAKEFFKAILSATLAISVTFFPFLFTMTGQMQEFVEMFPWTVTITLGVSLMVAMLFIPYIQFYFIREGFDKAEDPNKKKRKSLLDIIQETYEKWLAKAFKHPRVTLTGAFLAVVIGIALFTQVKQRLMPIAERDQFAVEIYTPWGNSLNQTAMVADSLREILMKDDRVVAVTSFIGTSSPRFHNSYASNFPRKNYTQLIVNTKSKEATVEVLDEYTPKYSDYFPNGHVRFKQLDNQDVTFPIEVRLMGDDMNKLKEQADSLSGKLSHVPGLLWIHSNYEEMFPGARVDLNQVEANRMGITRTVVATNLALRYSDVQFSTVWEGDYPVAVNLKSERMGGETVDEIKDEYIQSLIPGVSVPLRQIATVSPDWNPGRVVRRNGVLTVTICADVVRGYNTTNVFKEVQKITEAHTLPAGVKVQYGGAYENDGDNLPSIIAALIIAVFIIFLILLYHFRKINLAILVLSCSLLSFIGASAGLLIMDLEFGLTSVLGVISLIGILVRNGIIMLDYAEHLRVHGRMTALAAGFEAGKRRMRPIFLTSMAASMGVIPMIISRSAMWAPMGTVICFGTMASMVLLVLVLPVAYWLIFKNTDKNKKQLTVDELVEKANHAKLKHAVLTLAVVLGLSSAVSAQNSYSLEQCKNLALQNNAKVKNRALDINASEEVKKAVFTKFLPKVEASAIAFKVNDDMIKMSTQSGDLPIYDGNSANLGSATQFAYLPGSSISTLDGGTVGMVSAIQPIYNGERISTSYKQANLGIEVSRLQLRRTENEIKLETEQQYWEIVALTEKLKTLERYILLVDTLHKEVKDNWEAGLITRNDLLKVELKQNELQMDKLKLINGITLAKMSLCQYIGIIYGKEVSFTDNTTTAESPLLFYVDHQAALADRAEYQLLLKSTENEKYKTKLKRGEYMPELNAGVSAQYLDMMDNGGEGYGAVFGTVKIPISGLWEAPHTMKERRLMEDENRNTVKDSSEKLMLQMQHARNTLDESFQQVQLAEVAIRQAEENLKENHDNFVSGMINVSDMLDAQAQLQQSHDKYTDAITYYLTSKVNYLQVTGR